MQRWSEAAKAFVYDVHGPGFEFDPVERVWREEEGSEGESCGSGKEAEWVQRIASCGIAHRRVGPTVQLMGTR